MIAWVLGRGGLVGSSVEAKLLSRSTVWAPESPIQWDHKFLFENTFKQAMEQFTQSISNDDWAILWCAGNNVVSSSFEDLRREGEFIAFICLQLSLLPQSIQSRGILSFTSSAGGVYGGSSGRIFSEATVPKPINEYGLAKLKTEEQLLEFAKQTKLAVVIFRLANIYGPGQNLSKSQGIISAITNSLHYHKPVNIFVPLKTVRNFIYADDAGEVIARYITQLATDRKSNVFLKVVASDRNISLSSLMNEFRLVYGRRPMVVNTVSKSAADHPINLQLQSIVDDSSQNLSFTPLAVGIYWVRQGFFS